MRHSSPAITAEVYSGLTDQAVASLGRKLASLGG
jgi:hypothetical protein